jgi:enoyl-CoA hydratase/carnithine racemase
MERPTDGVTVLTLNNPARRNALDPPLAQALIAAVSSLRSDPAVRCVLVTGAGTAFCSGADLGALRDQPKSDVMGRRDLLRGFYEVFLGFRELPMPVIAAVNGAAVGAGLNLALSCDMRIAARSARFAASFVHLGIHPGGGTSYLLSRLVGSGVAAEMLMSGLPVDADRALAVRLVNRVVDDAALVTAALELATAIAANSPQAVRATKRTLAISLDTTFVATVELESLAQAMSQESADAAEGWEAFQQRRPPRFSD